MVTKVMYTDVLEYNDSSRRSTTNEDKDSYEFYWQECNSEKEHCTKVTRVWIRQTILWC